jgi:endo-1,3-1,4-beta-glycanase ExoK
MQNNIHKIFSATTIKLLGAFLLILIGCSSANAAILPFFYFNNKIDTRNWYVSDGWSNGQHQSCEWRAKSLSADGENLKITVSKEKATDRTVACGEIRTKELYSYGTYEARIKVAKGVGLNTSFFTYAGYPSPTLHDEIDFEFLGKDTTKVQVNYWKDKKQNPAMIDLGFDASENFHDYKFVWEPTRISWYIDGKLVHETKKDAAIPTNPQNLFMSLWTSSKILDQWMGTFNYKSPVNAKFEWVSFTPYDEIAPANSAKIIYKSSKNSNEISTTNDVDSNSNSNSNANEIIDINSGGGNINAPQISTTNTVDSKDEAKVIKSEDDVKAIKAEGNDVVTENKVKSKVIKIKVNTIKPEDDAKAEPKDNTSDK